MRRNVVIHVCDFCGRTEREVEGIVAGPGTADICVDCTRKAMATVEANFFSPTDQPSAGDVATKT